MYIVVLEKVLAVASTVGMFISRMSLLDELALEAVEPLPRKTLSE